MHRGSKKIGALDEDLARAIMRALRADPNAAAREALHYSWQACTERFLNGLAQDDEDLLKQAA